MITQLIDEASQMLGDVECKHADLIYEVTKWDDETRMAFIFAYRLKYLNDRDNDSDDNGKRAKRKRTLARKVEAASDPKDAC